MNLVRTLALVLVAACGEGPPASPSDLIREGERALASRDWGKAYDAFTEARTLISPNHKDIWMVRMGQIEAEAYLEPSRAKDHVLGLTRDEPGKMSADDYARLATALAQSSPESAIEVVTAGVEQYPDSVALVNLGPRLRKIAEGRNEPESVKELKKFGY